MRSKSLLIAAIVAAQAASAQDAPMSIYEVHLGSWRHRSDEDDRPLSYAELADDLADDPAGGDGQNDDAGSRSARPPNKRRPPTGGRPRLRTGQVLSTDEIAPSETGHAGVTRAASLMNKYTSSRVT